MFKPSLQNLAQPLSRLMLGGVLSCAFWLAAQPAAAATFIPTNSPQFSFKPTLIAQPSALNYDPASADYVPSPTAAYNVTINAPKRYKIVVVNQSSTRDTSNDEIGLLLDSSNPQVDWTDSAVEKINGAPVADQPLSLDLDVSNGFNPGWNILPSSINAVAKATTEELRFKATPKMSTGSSTATNFSTEFQSYIGYLLDGKVVRHKTESLDTADATAPTICGNGLKEVGESCNNCPADIGVCIDTQIACGNTQPDTDESCDTCPVDIGVCSAQLYNPEIEIVGSIHTDLGVKSKVSGNQIAKSVGDFSRIEAKQAVDRAILPILAGSSGDCTGGGTITGVSSDQFQQTSTNGGCLLSEGSISFFDSGATRADVTIEAPGGSAILASTLTLPTVHRTILIRGGDLHLRSNLAYPNKKSTLGIMVVKDSLGRGGNIYVYPGVTNLVGAYYAEGSIASVNIGSKLIEYTGTACPVDGSGGFCDRSSELRNQLYWQGALMTINTIGGSDKTPPECPLEIQNLTPAQGGCSGLTGETLRQIARAFDISYLRTFHAASGGTRAGRNPPTAGNRNGSDNPDLPDPPGAVSNNSAVIFEYDNRIRLNPPPLFEVVGAAQSSEVGY